MLIIQPFFRHTILQNLSYRSLYVWMTTFQKLLMLPLLYTLIYALTGFPIIQSIESYLKMDPVEKKKDYNWEVLGKSRFIFLHCFICPLISLLYIMFKCPVEISLSLNHVIKSSMSLNIDIKSCNIWWKTMVFISFKFCV